MLRLLFAKQRAEPGRRYEDDADVNTCRRRHRLPKRINRVTPAATRIQSQLRLLTANRFLEMGHKIPSRFPPDIKHQSATYTPFMKSMHLRTSSQTLTIWSLNIHAQRTKPPANGTLVGTATNKRVLETQHGKRLVADISGRKSDDHWPQQNIEAFNIHADIAEDSGSMKRLTIHQSVEVGHCSLHRLTGP